MSEIKRYRRFHGWDYAKGASLFVTMATESRRAIFGKVSNGKMVHSELGRIVLEALEAIPRLNPGISLFAHVVMPDHVHFNIRLAAGLNEPLKTFGKAIAGFKGYTLKQARLLGLVGQCPTFAANTRTGQYSDGQAVLGLSKAGHLLWQQGCHDWLCPNRAKIEATARYIAYNPLKWQLMYGCDRHLRIIEPLDSPRLDIGDYWKGVGNISLLAPEAPMASLRVSRRVHDVGAVVARMERAVEKGYTIISGFISPGERAVLAMLLSRKDARFIRMRTSCIPNARFRPESAYIDAFMEERYLEIARGNDETEFDRAACLDLNAEIVRIATAGVGLALYFQPDGLYRIGEDGVWRKVNG